MLFCSRTGAGKYEYVLVIMMHDCAMYDRLVVGVSCEPAIWSLVGSCCCWWVIRARSSPMRSLIHESMNQHEQCPLLCIAFSIVPG